jgi:multisubunit Na+/H+ antiporter MnhF subunit
MLIMGHPQFETQDDAGVGHGIPPIPEWQLLSIADDDCLSVLGNIYIDPEVENVFTRLRNIFQRASQMPLSTTRLHDLTCFVVHRLLLLAPDTADPSSSPFTECIRCAIILYMFIIHGPTYYSHAVILNKIVSQLVENFDKLDLEPRVHDSLDIWLLGIGMVASIGTVFYQRFTQKAFSASTSLQLVDSNAAFVRTKGILWLEMPLVEETFRSHWGAVLNGNYRPGSAGFGVSVSGIAEDAVS